VQWWFSALDQKVVAVGAERWVAQVVGIHVDGPDLWIQIAAAADPTRSAVLHITSGMRIEDALARIESVDTGTDPSRRPNWVNRIQEAVAPPLRLPARAQPATVRHLRGLATAKGPAPDPPADHADDRPAGPKIVQMAKKLYMIVEHFKGDAPSVYRRFRDRGGLVPEGVMQISVWVDATLKRCYQVMETDNPALLDDWMAGWSDLVDFEIHPVITSNEAAAQMAPYL
jgi:hypothetical protein